MYKVIERNGAPGGIRTPNLLIRSQVLYPVEPRARGRRWALGFPPRRKRKLIKTPNESKAGRTRRKQSFLLGPYAIQFRQHMKQRLISLQITNFTGIFSLALRQSLDRPMYNWRRKVSL